MVDGVRRSDGGVAGLMGSPLLAAPCKADYFGRNWGNATLARKEAFDMRVQIFHVEFMTAGKLFYCISLISMSLML